MIFLQFDLYDSVRSLTGQNDFSEPACLFLFLNFFLSDVLPFQRPSLYTHLLIFLLNSIPFMFICLVS